MLLGEFGGLGCLSLGQRAESGVELGPWFGVGRPIGWQARFYLDHVSFQHPRTLDNRSGSPSTSANGGRDRVGSAATNSKSLALKR